ncbi:hypothetical protein [Methylobacterium sp. ID0610]|uniref:hypothetical protein n=1 Tax=Methylobacterium carpenticola TaxID=3344827 RepID=UPI0036B6F568
MNGEAGTEPEDHARRINLGVPVIAQETSYFHQSIHDADPIDGLRRDRDTGIGIMKLREGIRRDI